MNSRLTTFLAIAALSVFLVPASPARAQGPVAGKDGMPASFTVISPIYGQLVRFSMPSTFVAASENVNGGSYIREAVLKGETVKAWTQMITVTGAKGIAGNPQVSPESFAVSMAAGFKKACPDTFAVKPFGAVKFGDQDGFVAVVGGGYLGALTYFTGWQGLLLYFAAPWFAIHAWFSITTVTPCMRAT